ncbi:GDSL-type esterase/lipase family protein [Mesorhizobium sp. 8]|uniref:GDSL-type esterase/lipase family protein n=1 Tax=Mesorhizobium sp. 8 TaxID=2584466 RepID=UPI00112479D4|nr:GDSL-type esterase/lipase family protein [Mesorhizobium sp. 8]QDC01648.1 GDSL family lipase [Mesorhizobium sp. 8]
MSIFPPARRSFSRICFIGDAFTVGAGDETSLGWVGRLCAGEWERGHDISTYNLGIRGNSSREIAKRWRQECEARLPANANGRLVFMFGGNDAKEVVGHGFEVPLEEAAANARCFMAEAAAWRPTLWIGLMPMNEAKPYPQLLSGGPQYRFSNARQAEYNACYQNIAAELGIPFLDLHTRLIDDPAWMALTQEGDGSNPTSEGYALVSAIISKWHAWRAWFD